MCWFLVLLFVIIAAVVVLFFLLFFVVVVVRVVVVIVVIAVAGVFCVVLNCKKLSGKHKVCGNLEAKTVTQQSFETETLYAKTDIYSSRVRNRSHQPY